MTLPGMTKTSRSASLFQKTFRVALRPSAPHIKRPLGAQDSAAGLVQRHAQAIAFPRQRSDIDAEILEIRHGVLHDRVREAPADRHLCREQGAAKRVSVFCRHQRRQREIAESLAGREQHLPVAIGDQGPGIDSRRACEVVSVEAQAAIGLVGQEEDPSVDPLRRTFEKLGKLLQHRAAIDPAGRIMRGVDDDHSGLRSYRGVDGGEVEVEGGFGQADLHRHGVGHEQRRLVTEPSRLREDRLIARVKNQPERHRDRGEGAGRQRDVRRLEGKPELTADGLGQIGLRFRLAGLVGEPVLVLRRCARPDRLAPGHQGEIHADCRR